MGPKHLRAAIEDQHGQTRNLNAGGLEGEDRRKNKRNGWNNWRGFCARA